MFKYRNLAAAILGFSMLFSAGVEAAGSQDVNVIVNGSKLSQPGVMLNGATMVPMRAIFEALGAEVKWDSATRSVKANKNTTEIRLTLGDPTAYVNGEVKTLSAPAASINGATMVPLRFIGEALGAEVKWDGATRTANVSGKDAAASADAGSDIELTVVNSNIKTGQTLEVKAEGEKDCKATFDIVSLQKDIPMVESKAAPGTYSGTFTATKDMSVRGALLVVRLKAKDGSKESVAEYKNTVCVNAAETPTLKNKEAASFFKTLIPAPGTTVKDAPVKIVKAVFRHDIKKGVMRMLLDGNDVSSSCTFAYKTMTYKPSKTLADGSHKVQVVGVDNDGEKVDYSWKFTCKNGEADTAAAADSSLQLTLPAENENIGDILHLVGTTGSNYKVDYEIQPQGNIGGIITIKGNHIDGSVKADSKGNFKKDIDLSSIKTNSVINITLNVYDAKGKKVETFTRKVNKQGSSISGKTAEVQEKK